MTRGFQFPDLGDINPKRSRKREGAEGWYPYYAGYTETFVREVLLRSAIPSGSVVLDPWNGSGTTTRVAHQLGYRAVGVDLNPVAAVVASAKVARRQDALHVGGLATDFLDQAESNLRAADDEPLTRWFRPSVAAFARSVQQSIIRTLATDTSGTAIDPASHTLPPLAAFLTLCLARALRRCATHEASSNPTWVKPSISPRRKADLRRAMLAEVKELSLALLDQDSTDAQIVIGDARKLPLSAASCALVVTSPPYCTRIDYAVSTSLELALLGIHASSLDTLRRTLTGTPLTRQNTGETADPARAKFGKIASRLLSQIKSHDSSDSSSYYHKTYQQYVFDANLSIREIQRVLAPGGMAFLVVQNSFYKEIEVDLAAMIAELGTNVGLLASIVASHPVRQIMSTMNTRSLAYRRERQYREDVVAFSRPLH